METAIDDAALARLQEDLGGDEEVVRELVETFLAETPALLARLDAALAAGDVAGAARIGHTLKSTSATFGAMRMSTHAKEVEDASPEQPEEARAAAERLLAEFGRVREALRDRAAR